jgi:hypothetical protein
MSYRLTRQSLIVLAGFAAGILITGANSVGAPLVAGATAAPADGPAYVVKLTRPATVGDRCRFVADGTVVRSLVANISGRQRTLRPSNMSIHFEAVEEVLAVNPTGQPTRVTYTIEKCLAVDGNNRQVLLEPGRVLTVDAGRWKSRLQLDQGTLTLIEEVALRALVSLPNLKDMNEDDCFGIARPVRVGESWPVNAEAVARLESTEGAKVSKQDVSGTVKLKAVQTVDGAPHLLIQGKVSVARWVPDPRDLPTGTQLVSGAIEVKFTRLLPADASGPCVTNSNSERAQLKLKTDEDSIGPDVLVDGKIFRTFGTKRTPLGVAPVASGQE